MDLGSGGGHESISPGNRGAARGQGGRNGPANHQQVQAERDIPVHSKGKGKER